MVLLALMEETVLCFPAIMEGKTYGPECRELSSFICPDLPFLGPGFSHWWKSNAGWGDHQLPVPHTDSHRTLASLPPWSALWKFSQSFQGRKKPKLI